MVFLRSPKTFESAFLKFCSGTAAEKVLGPMGLTVPHQTSLVVNPNLSNTIHPIIPLVKPGNPEQNCLSSKPSVDQSPSKPGMVRIDYAKLQPEIQGEKSPESVTKPSLNSTIERLKGKLGQGENEVGRKDEYLKTTSTMFGLVEPKVEGEVSAEEVFNLLLGVGITPLQPISILDR